MFAIDEKKTQGCKKAIERIAFPRSEARGAAPHILRYTNSGAGIRDFRSASAANRSWCGDKWQAGSAAAASPVTAKA